MRLVQTLATALLIGSFAPSLVGAEEQVESPRIFSRNEGTILNNSNHKRFFDEPAFNSLPCFKQKGQISAPVLELSRAGTSSIRARYAYSELQQGTSYKTVRRKLLRLGWRPVTSPDADVCQEGDTRCQECLQGDAQCRKWPEMEACAGTGEGSCLFVWRRKGRVIAVSTIDDPPLVAGVACRSGCRR